MSQVEVDKIIPQSGTTLTIGDNGDTIAIASGATLTSFTSTGIDDNATSTAITIDGNEVVRIGNTTDVYSPTYTEFMVIGNYTAAQNNGITFLADATNSSTIGFTDDTHSTLRGGIEYNHSGDSMRFTTFTLERMRITSAGNVGIGTTTPGVKLEILGTENEAGTQAIRLMENSTQGGFIKYDGLVNELQLGGYNSAEKTGIRIARSDATTYFNTNGSERMRITSSGDLLVGKTSANTATEGVEFRSFGLGAFTRSGNQPIIANRTSNDGIILELQKDGTTIGTISSNSNDNLTFGATTGGGSGLLFYGAGGTSPIILPMKENAQIDNAVDLGGSGVAFKDLYLGGGLYVGGTGTANKLDDYEEGLHEATLTPSTSGSVALGGTENTLSYVKIGNLVNVQGALGVNVPSSPVGYIKISMPFTAASLLENADNSACSLFINNVNSATVGDFIGYVLNGTSELRIFLGDTTYAEADSAQQLRSGTSITLNVSYRTT
jgi:hypothetical protein